MPEWSVPRWLIAAAMRARIDRSAGRPSRVQTPVRPLIARSGGAWRPGQEPGILRHLGGAAEQWSAAPFHPGMCSKAVVVLADPNQDRRRMAVVREQLVERERLCQAGRARNDTAHELDRPLQPRDAEPEAR